MLNETCVGALSMLGNVKAELQEDGYLDIIGTNGEMQFLLVRADARNRRDTVRY